MNQGEEQETIRKTHSIFIPPVRIGVNIVTLRLYL